jgi:thiamine-phosphate pyrophosphorylase
MRFILPPIYPITDKRLAGKASHLCIVKDLIRGGATFIQIRDKETPARLLLDDLRRCVEYASRHDARIIMNDRCDLALLSGAAGAHVGLEDLTPADARILLGRKSILGFSAHSLALIRRGNRLPVEYLGFGPVYATATKPDHAPLVGLQMLRTACRRSAKPVVAIGGIGLAEIRPVLAAGAASAAVISALMTAPSIPRQMEQFLKESESALDAKKSSHE